ncbi:cytochrome c oxidase subunit 3 [Winogradskyella sp. DF17]|uniref:Cytochrome c oxidase subunit 3 n=1 Tax=Winogradskyella pelagia TaxID=2819984 RepID=A0ABS3SYJ3_9FLAO|nr:cytochrome c oxidase subunit 3 [Winogradskyella sp. DF17]MBO3115558.1 cytochrome c oxidase subunit 3 [Winogradskyella sp. DF17]
MDLTQGTSEEKRARSKKMMLWFAIGSLVMSFAGLLSAFIVSSQREDWLTDFQLPDAFIVSTIIILASSLTFIVAKRALGQNNNQITSFGLLLTLILGITFVYYQFLGFRQIVEAGYNFTGPTSNVTMSFIYLIAIAHIAHVVAGLVCILVVIFNHFRKKYTPSKMLGLELAAIFWHFIDLLWLILFLFLYFFRYII